MFIIWITYVYTRIWWELGIQLFFFLYEYAIGDELGVRRIMDSAYETYSYDDITLYNAIYMQCINVICVLSIVMHIIHSVIDCGEDQNDE